MVSKELVVSVLKESVSYNSVLHRDAFEREIRNT
jgi:hypothetical protein